MTSAILEAIFGLCLLVLFVAKFLKVGPLLKVNEVWGTLGSKVNFINKWWFNLIFIGIAIALISAPIMESKASKLGVNRDEYSKLESAGGLYGMTAEQYFEESKKAKDFGYDNTASFIESKKMGIDNAADYANAKKLSAKNKTELQSHFDEMKKRGTNSIDQYVKLIEIEQAEKNKAANAEKLSNAEYLSEKYQAEASLKCTEPVERLAKHSFEWKDKMLEMKFPDYLNKVKSPGVLTVLGDKVTFQNGFGADVYMKYNCDYDTENKKVINVEAVPRQ